MPGVFRSVSQFYVTAYVVVMRLIVILFKRNFNRDNYSRETVNKYDSYVILIYV